MMFELIENYMTRPLDSRQSHLDESPCIEIGGDSRTARLLLAHHLGTTCPSGMKVQCCHYCGNAKCSNPNHLYWGTPSENMADAKRHGTKKNGWENLVNKYGEEKAREIVRNNAGGTGKIPWNKFSDDKNKELVSIIESIEPMKFGWLARASKKLGWSHTQVRRFTNAQGMKTYKRKS